MSTNDQRQTQLQQQLAELSVQLSELGIHNPAVPEDWIATPPPETSEADENIAADRAEAWIEQNAEVAELETRYNNIARALEKMATGTYGTCEICQQPIEDDRLDVNPSARTCKAHMDQEGELAN